MEWLRFNERQFQFFDQSNFIKAYPDSIEWPELIIKLTYSSIHAYVAFSGITRIFTIPKEMIEFLRFLLLSRSIMNHICYQEPHSRERVVL